MHLEEFPFLGKAFSFPLEVEKRELEETRPITSVILQGDPPFARRPAKQSGDFFLFLISPVLTARNCFWIFKSRSLIRGGIDFYHILVYRTDVADCSSKVLVILERKMLVGEVLQRKQRLRDPPKTKGIQGKEKKIHLSTSEHKGKSCLVCGKVMLLCPFPERRNLYCRRYFQDPTAHLL